MRGITMLAAVVVLASACTASEGVDLYKGEYGRLFASSIEVGDERLIAVNGDVGSGCSNLVLRQLFHQQPPRGLHANYRSTMPVNTSLI